MNVGVLFLSVSRLSSDALDPTRQLRRRLDHRTMNFTGTGHERGVSDAENGSSAARQVAGEMNWLWGADASDATKTQARWIREASFLLRRISHSGDPQSIVVVASTGFYRIYRTRRHRGGSKAACFSNDTWPSATSGRRLVTTVPQPLDRHLGGNVRPQRQQSGATHAATGGILRVMPALLKSCIEISAGMSPAGFSKRVGQDKKLTSRAGNANLVMMDVLVVVV